LCFQPLNLKLIFKYLTVFTCFGSFAQTLTAPQIGCVSILANNSISITWSVTPGLGGQFASYQIYTSSTLNNPTYTNQAGITNYNTNTYTIATISNANTHPYYIYINTITTSSLTLFAVDTVRPMLLTVSTPAGPGIAHLSWNGFIPPIPAGEASSYSIYKSYYYNGGGWQFVASVPSTGNLNYNYYDTITVCKDSINYKIELVNTELNCTSVSNIAGGKFQNKNKPTPPHIDSVSVINYETNNPQTIVGISSAYSQDVKCFKIYTFSLSTNESVDSICNYNKDTSYIYVIGASPASSSITPSVISKDSCGNDSPFPNYQSTIYTSSSYDQCQQMNTVNWTHYKYMVTGVDHYEVFCSTGGGPFVHLGLVSDTSTTVYYHKNVLPGTTYCYFVRAHSVGKTIAGKDTASSTSNQFCITTNSPPVPGFAYLNNVTVNAQQTIDVQWNVDNTVLIGGYNLYRATGKTGTYNLLSYIPSANNYTDGDVNTNSQEYFYVVQVLDTCKNPTIQTDTSNSIVLKAVSSANSTATLNWNAYNKYLGGVSGYNIYRSVSGVFGLAATTTSLVTTYVDDLSPFAADEGIFVYYVEAVEGAGDPYLLAEKSTSNYDTVYVDANLYIPNSFTPGGKNKVFLPIGAYIDNGNYALNIFNRYGEKIFESTNPNTGWDGGGHEEGVYAYTVQYQTSVGEYRQCHGTVNLIR